MTQSNKNRRLFLAATAAAATAPYFFSSQRSLADETKSANDRLRLGLIGAGGIAKANMGVSRHLLDIVQIADVDQKRRDAFSQKFTQGKAKTTEDYRDVIDNPNIDIIHVATPDHWHTKPVIEAMLAGKDVYCEKPLTLTIDEGKLIREVQKRTGRVVQVGTQQRSRYNLFVKALALVNEGRLGNIKQVQAAIGGAPSSDAIPVAEVPGHLNWDRWVGPTPTAEYRHNGGRRNGRSNCHGEFRWWYEYSGGKLTDWGAHHVDICAWALRLNGQTEGPIGISGSSKHPVKFDENGMPMQRDRYNTATAFQFKVDYPSGAEMVIRHDTDNGVLITGDKGRIFVSRGKLVGKPVEDLKDNPLPEDAIQKVYGGMPIEKSDGRRAHWENFVRCVRERRDPISDVHTHMEMLNVCHLAGIAARLNRPLKWDSKREQIVGDDVANAMLKREYRDGYEIEM